MCTCFCVTHCAYVKVLITPHVSAVSYADDVAELFARNLCHYVPEEGGERRGADVSKLLYTVDWEQGY